MALLLSFAAFSCAMHTGMDPQTNDTKIKSRMREDEEEDDLETHVASRGPAVQAPLIKLGLLLFISGHVFDSEDCP